AFAVYHAIGVGMMHDAASVFFGGAQPAQIKVAVDRFHLTGEHPQRNLRGGAVMRCSERPSAWIGNFHRLARLSAVAISDITGEDPGVPAADAIGGFPIDPDLIHRIACRRAMRSSVEGCVENSRIRLWPVNGLMMNRCAVAGEASIGIRFDHVSSFCRPLISGYGEPMYLAEAASASYSRDREIAIWISIAAIGARIIISSGPNIPPPRSSSSLRGPNQNAIRASIVMVAASIAATELVRMSRCSTCPSSCATTPSISVSFINCRIPVVNATEACDGLRPVANAFGDCSGISHSLGMGTPIRCVRFRT